MISFEWGKNVGKWFLIFTLFLTCLANDYVSFLCRGFDLVIDPVFHDLDLLNDLFQCALLGLGIVYVLDIRVHESFLCVDLTTMEMVIGPFSIRIFVHQMKAHFRLQLNSTLFCCFNLMSGGNSPPKKSKRKNSRKKSNQKQKLPHEINKNV